MTTKHALPLAMAIAIVAFAGAKPAFAQAAPPADSSAIAAKTQAEKRAKVEKRLEQIRNRILKKEVGLDDKKAAEVEKIFGKYETERRKLAKDQREHKQALRQLLKDNSDDEPAYKKEMQALRETQKKLKSLNDREADDLSKVMTHKQQAKLMAALQRLRRVLARRAAAAAKDKE